MNSIDTPTQTTENLEMQKPKRGGSRPGAGRPPGPKTKQLVVLVLPATHTRLSKIAKRYRLSRGQVIDSLIANARAEKS